jgi:putative FmdB family regulatory protein
MPTYEYECGSCGHRFERRQAMSDTPVDTCPECAGKVRRLLSGGGGILLKNGNQHASRHSGDGCSYEREGQTCCGRRERCDQPACGGSH